MIEAGWSCPSKGRSRSSTRSRRSAASGRSTSSTSSSPATSTGRSSTSRPRTRRCAATGCSPRRSRRDRAAPADPALPAPLAARRSMRLPRLALGRVTVAQVERRLGGSHATGVTSAASARYPSRTRFGRIVRADTLRQLTPAGWSALADYGVKTVLDLRFQSGSTRTSHSTRVPAVLARDGPSATRLDGRPPGYGRVAAPSSVSLTRLRPPLRPDQPRRAGSPPRPVPSTWRCWRCSGRSSGRRSG